MQNSDGVWLSRSHDRPISLAWREEGWGVGDFKGAWGIERSDHAKWSEEDRLKHLGETCMFLKDLLKKSGKNHVSELVGVPVEVTFEGDMLKSWRPLEEVLP